MLAALLHNSTCNVSTPFREIFDFINCMDVPPLTDLHNFPDVQRRTQLEGRAGRVGHGK